MTLVVVAVLLTAGTAFAAFAVTNALTLRARMARRLRLASGTVSGAPGRGGLRVADVRQGVGRVMAVLGRLMPLGEEDREKIAVSLRRAGSLSDTAALATVLGMKAGCLLVGLVLGLVLLPPRWPGLLGWGIGLVGGFLGGVILNLLPELVVSRLAAARLRRIHGAVAETFDLLIICLESGLTFERALRRTVDNLKSIHPDIARELGRVSLEISVHGRGRTDALGRLAERLDSQDFRDLAVTAAQSERHGTPLAEALRKLAGSVRVQSVARMQAEMGRLPTLLIVPSIALILPGVMVVVGGPAFVHLTESLGSVGG